MHRTMILAGLAALLGLLATGVLSANPATGREEEYDGKKWFCIAGRPANPLIPFACAYIETDYTNDPNGLDLTNEGSTFPGAAAFLAAAAVTPPPWDAVLLAAATLVGIECGHVGPVCKGADVIKNYLEHPEKQDGILDPGIAWSKADPSCGPDCSTPSITNGSAGPFNSQAEVRCARGRIVHLAITWDGDIHADLGPVNAPSINALINKHNIKDPNNPEEMISESALVVELPLWDRALFSELPLLRGNQIVEFCGRWVTDANSGELWNELHPPTSLWILSDPDTEPPVIRVPQSPVVAEATGPYGGIVAYTATAADAGDELIGLPVTPDCTPPSGSTFPLGDTTVTCIATDSSGHSATATFNVRVQDTSPPSISCDLPDGAWHATDVSIQCTASDIVSGLANPADASFSLSTSVLQGTETDNAATASRIICDTLNNCATAGPIAGNKVDKKPPEVIFQEPSKAVYLTDQVSSIQYWIRDDGSGPQSSSVTLDGAPAARGQVLDMFFLNPGAHTIAVTATDNVGNSGVTIRAFEVQASSASLTKNLDRALSLGLITDADVFKGLMDKLNAAAKAHLRGQHPTEWNQLSAFIQQLLAQEGKGVDSAVALRLIAYAQDIINRQG